MRLLLSVSLALAGCITEQVTRADVAGERICVLRNAASFPEFLDALAAQLSVNGHEVAVVNDQAEALACPVRLTYAATRGVRYGPYLSTANIEVFRGSVLIGRARYHAPGTSMAKHVHIREKVREIADALLPPRGTGTVAR